MSQFLTTNLGYLGQKAQTGEILAPQNDIKKFVEPKNYWLLLRFKLIGYL